MGGTATKNPEEIELGDDDSDSESRSEEEGEGEDTSDVPQQKKVPDEVSATLLYCPLTT